VAVLSPASPKVGEPDGLEDEIRAACARGDRDGAITLLMRAHGTAVYRYCRRLMGGDADAYDVLQVVFLQAFQGLGGLGGIASVKGWLLGIARHRCIDVLRARRRRGEHGPAPEREIDEGAADGPAADARADAREAAAVLDDCLDKLQAPMRVAVLFHFRDELSYDEIASATGERAGTLRVRVARALPLLRRCLERSGVGL
jgi:RNA polymerase sigma-70 factor (ECF subfamily)